MLKNFIPPVSIEEFAAYLDGNLSEDEMNRIEKQISANPDMEEIMSMSDIVDENEQTYLQDEFAYEADMTALEDCDFDIPYLDSEIHDYDNDDITLELETECASNDTYTQTEDDDIFAPNELPCTDVEEVFDDEIIMTHTSQDLSDENYTPGSQNSDGATLNDDIFFS